MPEHYAVLQVNTVLGAPLNAFQFLKSPLTGFIQDIYVSVGSNVPTDAVFDVRKNGTTLWPGAPANRPKIVGGASSGSKLLVNAAVTRGDLIQIDAITVPTGGLPVPLVVQITFYDTIALRSSLIYITSSLNDLQLGNFDIPLMGRGWKLVSVAADRACWVRGYVSAAARTADAARVITVDASENAGLCVEIIFTASLLSVGYGAPFPEGFNLDDPNSLDAIFAIQNLSGSAQTVQLTFVRLITER